MECPNCKLENPEGSLRCDCGHAFSQPGHQTLRCPCCAGTIEAAELKCRLCGKSLAAKAEAAAAESSALGTVAFFLGIGATLMPYLGAIVLIGDLLVSLFSARIPVAIPFLPFYAAMLLAPAAVICGLIACAKGQRGGFAGFVLGIIGAISLVSVVHMLTGYDVIALIFDSFMSR